MTLRIATYNIRNVRALDRASWWWRRRGRLAHVLRSIDVDIWALQEAYPSQVRWIGYYALADAWDEVGEGRNRRGGEAVPIWVHHDQLEVVDTWTLWYGSAPDEPGSRLPGARFPRIATIAEIEWIDTGESFVVANTHLDESSPARRRESLEQLTHWLPFDDPDHPVIVVGDLNCTLDEDAVAPLLAAGLQPVLDPADGPTANDFGRNPDTRQIDHIFVSGHWAVDEATIHTDAGHASDHWPVAATLSLVDR